MSVLVREILRNAEEIDVYRIWETVPRRSAIFNPEVMQGLEARSMFALVYGEPKLAQRLRTRLWQHQFQITEQGAEWAAVNEPIVSDLSRPFEQRRGAAVEVYKVLSSSSHVSPNFEPEAAADIRMSHELHRPEGDIWPDVYITAEYMARILGEIYGIGPSSIEPTAERHAFAYQALSMLWEPSVESELINRLDLGTAIAEGIKDYYIGLHDALAVAKGYKTWDRIKASYGLE